jgi:predicted unusual protein kinase regulating ubiquinone biosynthesis (AarF/ABC1/UbiB family)
MQFLDAEVLSTFIKDSTQKQKNYIGKKIVEFIFILFYKHCIFYTDIHYGNFLVKDKDKLAVIDFGAISKFEPELLSNIKNLHKIMFTDDKIGFYQIVEDLGILTSKTSLESKEYMYSYFKMQFKPFTCDKMFNFSDEYIALTLEKNMDLLKQWELPPGMIHLNRIPYGLYNLLNKLNVTANVTKIVRKLLTEDI